MESQQWQCPQIPQRICLLNKLICYCPLLANMNTSASETEQYLWLFALWLSMINIKSANAPRPYANWLLAHALTHTLFVSLSPLLAHKCILYSMITSCRRNNPLSILKDKTKDNRPLSVTLCFIVFKIKISKSEIFRFGSTIVLECWSKSTNFFDQKIVANCLVILIYFVVCKNTKVHFIRIFN